MNRVTSSSPLSRRGLLAGGVGLLAACSGEPGPAQPPDSAAPPPPADPLAAAIGASSRPVAERARDRWRHPAETLVFLGLKPGATVVEFWPGAGWWTQILAPYLSATSGRYIAAHLPATPDADALDREIVDRYRERFANISVYGQPQLTAFGPASGPVAPAGSADLVLFMRNLHNWMAAGLVEKAFRDARDALKPGGVLGIEQHRAAAGGVQDPLASDGYVQEAFVRQLATEAGFRFDAASGINANPRDDREHPFGVWTLPPVRRSSPRGQPENPEFDHAEYDRIGESDRMTLRFRKP